MKERNRLSDLLHQKIERQAILGNKIILLNQTSIQLSGTKLNRWFSSSYLLIKRIITLFIGVSLLLTAAYLLLNPQDVINETLTKELVEKSKNNYFELVGKTFAETIIELAKKEKPSLEQINIEFTKAVERVLLEEIYSSIRFFACLLIPLALFLLYISRLTKKMRQRNHKISEAQSLAQEVILNYSQDLNYLNNEIELLKDILKDKDGTETIN